MRRDDPRGARDGDDADRPPTAFTPIERAVAGLWVTALGALVILLWRPDLFADVLPRIVDFCGTVAYAVVLCVGMLIAWANGHEFRE